MRITSAQCVRTFHLQRMRAKTLGEPTLRHTQTKTHTHTHTNKNTHTHTHKQKHNHTHTPTSGGLFRSSGLAWVAHMPPTNLTVYIPMPQKFPLVLLIASCRPLFVSLSHTLDSTHALHSGSCHLHPASQRTLCTQFSPSLYLSISLYLTVCNSIGRGARKI